MRRRMLLSLLFLAFLSFPVAKADPIYLDGTAGACGGCTFGDHLVSPELHPSVAGVGGSGLDNFGGEHLDAVRTYIYDRGAAGALAAGVTSRGDADFAMMIWDVGTPLDTVRLYTDQDHYGGGPITDPFVAQDVMEYSVWGSHDGDSFVLLSDVIGFDIAGGGFGKPTYTFAGMAPTVIYRGGSAEIGIHNAYTRDYTFSTAYQYYGIRTSSISLAVADADPEIDAVAFHSGAISAPEPGTLLLLGSGLLGVAGFGRKKLSRKA